MGYARPKPKRLAEKLRQIRQSLGLSQGELHRRLGVEDLISYTQISKYESGLREPLLMVLLQYARVAGVNTEALIDDELDLPARLPGTVKHDEITRTYRTRPSKKRPLRGNS
jgi:transcriptional regulator with XRE-family HTH domain